MSDGSIIKNILFSNILLFRLFFFPIIFAKLTWREEPIFSRSTPSLKSKTPISSFSGQNGGMEPNLAQDLTAPVVRPLMICFCASR